MDIIDYKTVITLLGGIWALFFVICYLNLYINAFPSVSSNMYVTGYAL